MGKSNYNYFKILSLSTAVIFTFLFFTLLFNTESFLIDLGLQANDSSLIITRRASMFMLGVSILMYGSINIVNSKAIQVISLATAISMFGLSCLGIYELNKGSVNKSILIAIIIETILWISFTFIFITKREKATELA